MSNEIIKPNKSNKSNKQTNPNNPNKPNNPISINISNESNFTEDEYSEFKKYIVINNISLQKEVRESISKIKELEAQIQKQETSEDNYETHITYMKGLLQNLNELRNDYNKITSKTESKLKLAKESNKRIKNLNFEIYAYLVIINSFTIITPFTFEYYNIYILLLQILYTLVTPYCIFKIKNSYSIITNIENDKLILLKEINNEITKIKIEIIKTEKATLTLDNWIHEM